MGFQNPSEGSAHIIKILMYYVITSYSRPAITSAGTAITSASRTLAANFAELWAVFDDSLQRQPAITSAELWAVFDDSL